MEYGRPLVFIDADVLMAGSASTTGASHIVLRLSELGLIDGVVSAQVVEEVERNLGRKLPSALPAFRALLTSACRAVEDPSDAEVHALRGQAHVKDLPILAAAVRAGCEWLVTFNVRHFHPTSGRPTVAEPGRFVEILRRMLEDLAEQR